jgi:putative ABC transport system permease protein
LIVPYGYERPAKAALLRGEPSTYYMGKDVYEKVRSFPGVSKATPQFFLASLATECCSERVQIIAYDQDSDFLVKPWLASKVSPKLTEGQIVAGSKLNIEVGGKLYFFGLIHEVVAKMEPTGMGLDTSVFLPLATVYKLIDNIDGLKEKLTEPSDYISAVAVKVEDGQTPKDIANGIMQAYAIECNLDLVMPDAIVTETAKELAGWSSTVGRASAVMWVMALLALGMVFSVSVGERRREFGIYRLIGAKRQWLSKLIFMEAVLVSLGGAVLGLLTASLIIFPFDTLIFQSLGLPNLPASPSAVAWAALSALILALVIAPLACLRSVLALTRSDVQSSLREEN